MDTRNRQATKRFRNNQEITFKTVSVNISKKILDTLDKKIKSEENQNMSAYVENLIAANIDKITIKNDRRRAENGSFPAKKTYTFSLNFFEKIKSRYPDWSTGFLIETLLTKILNIK